MAGKLIKIPDVNDLRRTIFPGGVIDESSEPVVQRKKNQLGKRWIGLDTPDQIISNCARIISII